MLPPVFIASWKLYDGEWTKSRGMYNLASSRLLSVQEIIHTLKEWNEFYQQQSHHGGIVVTTADNRNGKEVLRIPLFTETVNHRQVAMELQRQIDDDDYNEKDNQTIVIHGRIILTSSIVPYAPHLKVLASSWDTFLTLV
mmetsp:Transcript_30336/g.44302  ORF Transcript_30336/g.44302 Transcript_30336/m.44302 type:complete len:140 (-) Transcript_30336:61-480(-)